MAEEIDVAPLVVGTKIEDENTPRKKNDELLKGAFKENFPDFLRFVYPDADEVIDFDKEIEFMDKELFAIIPDRERKNDKRAADLLAKLHLKDGTEKWVLLNVEIEAGRESDFAFRLHQYNYRARESHGVPVATIAVFIGDQNQSRPTEYRDELLGTVLSFKYLSYHVFDHSAESLMAKRNPFALIALACQKALLEKKIPDEELGEERLKIARLLLSQNYEPDRIISFMIFLKNFIFINNKDINNNFDQQINTLTGGKIDMSILEIVKMQERRDGRIEGKMEGRHEEAVEIATKLKAKKMVFDEIAELTGLSVKEVEALV
ncbi:MAG: hypothetical protein WC623_12260 [Pedobacter sp.]|uniref:hypothetical protein n=1 Tax=Pedobacter sp. TaxID=1411316 RepID=UPI003568C8A2